MIDASYSAARPPYASSDVVVFCVSDRLRVQWDVCTVAPLLDNNRLTLLPDDPYGEPRMSVLWLFCLGIGTGGIFEQSDKVVG